MTDCIRAFNSYEEANVRLRDRIYIMRKHSAIYNQLSAPTFRPMLYYAWKESGYVIETDFKTFKNVLQV